MSSPAPIPDVTSVQHSLHLAARYRRCRVETAPGYPARAAVAPWQASWSVPMASYAPPHHVAERVLAQNRHVTPGGWADAESDRAQVAPGAPTDADGRLLCPMGRTGIRGRGLLGRWGPNHAVDVVLLWLRDASLHLLLIERAEQVTRDGVAWHPLALPGGMVDGDESAAQAMSRELKEETGVSLAFGPEDGAVEVYSGPVDDPRSTDHAWIETTACYRLLDAQGGALVEGSARGGDDARLAQGMPITAALLARLYASHGDVVRRALWHLASQPARGEASRLAARLA